MKNKRFKSAFLFVPILLLATFGASNRANAQVVASNTSDNWAGYTALGSGFSKVTGTWVVPRVIPTSNSTIEADTTWVGVGGVNNWNLIQAGTQAVVQYGNVVYHSWYELLPDVAINTPLAVKPGDSVTATITETSPNNWLIEIRNNTTGDTWTKTVYYESVKSSVEWIEEAPTHENSVLPIDNFGSVTFTGAYAVENGTTYAANDLALHSMILKDASGNVLASPSPFGNSSSFSVTSTVSTYADSIPVPTQTPTVTTVPSATVTTSTVTPTTPVNAVQPTSQTYTTDTTSYVPIVQPGQIIVTTSRAPLLQSTITISRAYIVPAKVAVHYKVSKKAMKKKVVKKVVRKAIRKTA